MRVVAITGGTGFIGTRLVRRLVAGGDMVRVLSRRPLSAPGLPDSLAVYQGDLTGEGSDLAHFLDGVDILYHCAGEISDPNRMQALHLAGTRKLAEAAADKIGHWVQLSSVGAYGPQFNTVVTEETPPNPVGVYEETKTAADELVRSFAQDAAFTCTILRPAIVFGPDMKNRSLFQLMAMLDKGRFFFIGKPGAAANYIQVENVVEALVLCGRRPVKNGEIYNLSEHWRFEEFILLISQLLGKPSPTLRLPENLVRLGVKVLGRIPGFPLTASRIDAMVSRTVYATEKIENELGYKPVVSMAEGLGELVEAWKKSVRRESGRNN
jgi:nucleoside-diphosphate-sugar epimerase